MTEMLPLFPLGTVLYPGLPLPLHIFEPRYRQLVRDLLDGPQPGRFGVIAIRKGRETGVDGVSALYEIGCTATLRQIAKYEDGRFDIVTVGSQRFRLAGLDDSRPYLQAEVELLEESTGDRAAAALAAGAVQRAFGSYVEALRQTGGHRGQRAGAAGRADPAVLPGGGVDDPGPAGPAGAAGRAGRGAPAGQRAGAAGPGDHHAPVADRHPAPELRNSPYSPN